MKEERRIIDPNYARIEKMQEYFNLLGIPFEIENFGAEIKESDYDGKLSWNKKLTISNGIGYYDFRCDFYFLNGVFQGHGVWE